MDYDFGALENTDNKLTKSYANLMYGSLTFCCGVIVTIDFHSFNVLGKPSKRRLFMMDSFKWAPKGFGSWLLDKNESPGIVRLRENKTYTRDVAAKLIEEKKKELKDGTSRRDLLSLLGPSCLSFLQHNKR